MSPLIAGIMLVQAGGNPCGTMHEIAQRLASEFHEKSVAMGISQAGQMLGLYASPEGTWTIVKVIPEGRACIVDAGKGFQLLPQGDPT